MHYVYLIKSVNYLDQVYVGYTTDVGQRLQKHNDGGSFHTAKYRPWKLHAYFAFEDKEQALAFEKYLKSHSGRAFANKRIW